MRFHFLMSSLLRPQLTHRSLLSWQTEMQGFSISLAIVSHLWPRVIESGDFSSLHRECVGTLPPSRSEHCDLKG